ncbi:MAG: hypothetical protein OEZ41_01775 [Nitrospirota bacterium]|nr:hypothetical protein [Nitrospirota bacterium]
MKKLTKLIIGSAGILALSYALGTAPANAAQRDVIADAGVICGAVITEDPASPIQNACDLRDNTNGLQILEGVCTDSFDGIDNEVADYLLRNCDRNEEALLRQASSAVLSLDDALARGKEKQKETAAGYLCSYAVKADLLVGTGKLVFTVKEPPVDLAEDARDIASALGFPCD